MLFLYFLRMLLLISNPVDLLPGPNFLNVIILYLLLCILIVYILMLIRYKKSFFEEKIKNEIIFKAYKLL